MNNKLYVGNLSWNVTEDQLKELFAEAGTVTSAAIIVDRDNDNKSKGFGFVEMSTDEEANKAIELLHERDVDGRPLTVNIARPKEERN